MAIVVQLWGRHMIPKHSDTKDVERTWIEFGYASCSFFCKRVFMLWRNFGCELLHALGAGRDLKVKDLGPPPETPKPCNQNQQTLNPKPLNPKPLNP